MKISFILILFIFLSCSNYRNYTQYKKNIEEGFQWELELAKQNNTTVFCLRDSLKYKFILLPYEEWSQKK